MRTTPIIAAIAASLLAAAAPSLAAPSAAAKSPLDAVRTAYLDGLFRAKPHLASVMGDHRFDDKVVDLSPEAQKKRLAELDAQEKKIRAIDPASLSMDDQIDRSILLDGIALERVYLTDIQEWTWS